MQKEIYKLHAEICKTLSNPKRLAILNSVRDKEKIVSDIAKDVKISQANISQHLTILRQRNILKTRREGRNIYYKLAYPEMIKACDIIRNVLYKQLDDSKKIAKKMKKVI